MRADLYNLNDSRAIYHLILGDNLLITMKYNHLAPCLPPVCEPEELFCWNHFCWEIERRSCRFPILFFLVRLLCFRVFRALMMLDLIVLLEGHLSGLSIYRATPWGSLLLSLLWGLSLFMLAHGCLWGRLEWCWTYLWSCCEVDRNLRNQVEIFDYWGSDENCWIHAVSSIQIIVV